VRLGFALSSTSINREHMNSKNLMTVMTVVAVLIGLALIILPTQITSMNFPTVDEEVIVFGA